MSLPTIPNLIDELRSDDSKKRLNSVKNLSSIAQAMGTEKTKNELLPFLEEFFSEDDDEILTELIEVLTGFFDYIGGPQNYEKLLRVLEGFVKLPETTIREKAIDGIKKILKDVDPKGNEEVLAGFLKRTYNSEYHCSKQCVAVLLPGFFKGFNPNNQAAGLNMFLGLANHDVPLVRKFAAKNLPALIKVVNTNNEKDVLEIFNILMKDSQDLNRIYLVDSLINLYGFTCLQKNPNMLLGFFKVLAENSSWRIKYAICDKIQEMGEVMGKDTTKQVLLPFFLKSLQDVEPELRTIAASRIDKICKILEPEDIISKVAPLFKSLLFDSQSFVRCALAGSLLSVSLYIGKKPTTDLIFPVFSNLLKDQDSEVRINLFKKLGDITKVLGVENLLNSITPAFQELLNEKNWRVRKSALEYLPILAKQIGSQFFNDKMNKIVVNSFTDKVYAVREAVTIAIKEIAEILGASWLEQNILPSILQLSNIQNYLYRQTLIYIIINIVNNLNPPAISSSVIPLLAEMSKDSVPNVKIASAKALKVCYKYVQSQTDKEKIKKLLNMLGNDADFDVKFIAKQNYESL